jgi:hypothetical protein
MKTPFSCRISVLILFLLHLCLSSFGKSGFEKVVSVSELNMQEGAMILNIRQLDDRYIHFIARDFPFQDGAEFAGVPFVYDLQERRIINYTYDSVAKQFYSVNTLIEEANGDDKPYFSYLNGKLYYLTGNVNPQLVSFNFENGQRMKYPISGPYSYSLLSAFEKSGQLYLTISGDEFRLFKLDENGLSSIFETDVYRNIYEKPLLLNAVSFLLNDKLIISEVNQIRAFDFEHQKLDTLIVNEDLIDTYETTYYNTTMLS